MCADQRRRPRRAPPPPHPCLHRQRGLSLIELMVGIVVALLVGLAAVGGASVFTASQRQGIGVGSSNVNLGGMLAAIKSDVSSAGLGFFGDGRFLCNRLNLGLGNSRIIDGDNFTPVRITRTQAGSDRIDVVYATQVAAGTNVLLDTSSNGSAARLRSLLPVAVGQAVMLAPATPGDPCVVRTVTANTPAAGEVRQLLAFANTPAGVHNQVAFSTNPTYSDRARVTLLGALRWSRYERSGTDLVLSQPLGGGSAVLLRNVIVFRAQYGVAANVAGSTTLENWQDATGGDFGTLTSAALPRVRALRIGIVTRSPQREKPDASGNCAASSAKPVLFGVTVEPDVADWQCFRYRTAVAVVPLRNLVYGMTP